MKSLVCGTNRDSLISITFRLQSYAQFLKPPNFSPKICRMAFGRMLQPGCRLEQSCRLLPLLQRIPQKQNCSNRRPLSHNRQPTMLLLALYDNATIGVVLCEWLYCVTVVCAVDAVGRDACLDESLDC